MCSDISRNVGAWIRSSWCHRSDKLQDLQDSIKKESYIQNHMWTLVLALSSWACQLPSMDLCLSCSAGLLLPNNRISHACWTHSINELIALKCYIKSFPLHVAQTLHFSMVLQSATCVVVHLCQHELVRFCTWKVSHIFVPSATCCKNPKVTFSVHSAPSLLQPKTSLKQLAVSCSSAET